ncbi:sialate O-acetylesterase, partial [Draconibacterium sp.]|nr:sialate O-acetylesterase [Draconibacterium sp.]
AQDTIVQPKVYALNKNNMWVPAQDPIHFDKKVAGVGLGRTFGIEMAKANPNTNIGLIPCAVGGSPIDAWQPGEYHKQTETHPWDDMEKRLKIALKGGTLKGILWHQGESDSNPAKCNEYEAKLKDLIQRVRILGDNPDAPFVAGEFGRFKLKSNKGKYPELKPSPAKIVMQSTKRVIKKDKNAALVKSKGLNHKGDNTHFDAESYREFGLRYAKAMLKLQK